MPTVRPARRASYSARGIALLSVRIKATHRIEHQVNELAVAEDDAVIFAHWASLVDYLAKAQTAFDQGDHAAADIWVEAARDQATRANEAADEIHADTV